MKPLVRSAVYGVLILPFMMFVVPRAEAQPVVHGIVNAASGDLTSIARGSFMTIYGENLGAQAGPPSSLPLPTNLGGATVTITPSGSTKNYQAYLHFVSPGQINAVMPSAVPAGSAFLTVTVNNQTSLKRRSRSAKATSAFSPSDRSRLDWPSLKTTNRLRRYRSICTRIRRARDKR